ncbi:MAG TPA: MFS transporter [Ilumatobacter sp.]|nr:MFS transporter [Ilumatobacter sp.]
MRSVIDTLAPPRMGASFRWLMASSWLSNLGDGMSLAAGPLLVASQTSNPFLVAMAALVQRLPWMLFGLHAGVVADRHDRKRVVALVNSVRAGVIALLTVVVATDVTTIELVLGALFVLGTAETYADVTTGTLLPMIVERDDLGVANARMSFGLQSLNQLVGPPLGALLFGIGMAVPFAAQAVLLAAAVRCVLRIEFRRLPDTIERQPARRQVADGLRWLWSHGPMRTLTITIVAFNVTFGAAWAVLVLYALDHLGMGDVGFGLLTAASAVGSIVGAAGYGWTVARIGAANIMRLGLVVEAATHLSLALTQSAPVALFTLFVFGVHIGMWGTTAHTARQRQVPLEYQGRVGSVYLLGMQGGLVIGAPIGGLLASRWGITAPFWFAFAGSCLILVLIWKRLAAIAA